MVLNREMEPDWFDLQCTASLPKDQYGRIVEHMALSGCKWDIQVGDVATLAPFALTISRQTCADLFHLAESLTEEIAAIERELSHKPELWPELGLPPKVCRILGGDAPWTPAAARIIRYDFHPTEAGWKISEANSDVPGGLNEAATLAEAIADCWDGLEIAGNPLAELAGRLAESAGRGSCIALVSAPGYAEDHQVVAGVAAELQRKGVESLRIKPEQLRWENGHAYARMGENRYDFGAIYRFFQGEWSTRFESADWRFVFRGGLTPVCNPGAAVLTESKRLPLLWSAFSSALPTWRRLLPATLPPWRAAFSSGNGLVWKDAYCNTGDAVLSRTWSSRRAWALTIGRGLLQPRQGIAQERFTVRPMSTPLGPMSACLGVYTINGKAAGIYGRLSPDPVINYSARDIAVLIRR